MKINPDKVPATVTEAVAEIMHGLDEKDIDHIKSDPSSSSVHHGIGMHLRNTWSLWEIDSPLKRDAVYTYGIAHADDISGLIWAWVWAIINNHIFDPLEHCKHYHKHWAEYGTTALEAGGWKELTD